MTQSDMILAALLAGETLTPLDALKRFGCFRLGARVAFVGRSFSYETWYQAVRRSWRYGQKRELQIHLAVAEGEDQIGRIIDRKAADHVRMKAQMVTAMRRALGKDVATKIPYRPTHKGTFPSWLKTSAA